MSDQSYKALVPEEIPEQAIEELADAMSPYVGQALAGIKAEAPHILDLYRERARKVLPELQAILTAPLVAEVEEARAEIAELEEANRSLARMRDEALMGTLTVADPVDEAASEGSGVASVASISSHMRAKLEGRSDPCDRPLAESECYSCGEKTPAGECPKSKRPCGHHCNCSWVHDHCHWCGREFGDVDAGDDKEGSDAS